MTGELDPREPLLDTEIARAVQEYCARAQQEARVPSADAIWMRAMLRARAEANARAARPIVVAQGIGISAFAALLVSMLDRLPLAALPQVPYALVALVLGGWLVFAPVAAYLAFSRD